MRIRRSTLDQLSRHVEAGYPNEACGVMLGLAGTVSEIVPAENTRQDSARNRYLIDPLVYRKVESDADRRGVQVLGIYHSHPDVAACPSEFDRQAAFPSFSYLIVSVKQGRAVEFRSWRLRDDYRQFDQEPLDITDEPDTVPRTTP